jgi:hypothetical protein
MFIVRASWNVMHSLGVPDCHLQCARSLHVAPNGAKKLWGARCYKHTTPPE